jgi:hypothetical protein
VKSNLVLGTATFGTNYGVANSGKVMLENEIKLIIQKAETLNIQYFDTATGYGEAEVYLGKYLNLNIENRICSKVTNEETRDLNTLIKTAKRILDRTKSKKLWALMLHSPAGLEGQGSKDSMIYLEVIKRMGLVENIGISTYNKEELIKAKESYPALTVFQLPENICDRRSIDSEKLLKLSKEGNHIFVRSLFLQGLLLMDTSKIPRNLISASVTLGIFEEFAKSQGVSRLDLCLAYARQIPWAAGLIVGAFSAKQLEEISNSNIELPDLWEKSIPQLSATLINPRNW